MFFFSVCLGKALLQAQTSFQKSCSELCRQEKEAKQVWKWQIGIVEENL
jgi:hypothetical protein